ncbi:312 [Drosophila busckii]|uniref:Mitochondrial assembly of ribosomal large subunit protein 1 n=1 Tax=Drosophila busckii TaxID=30019 RepID=A0A0M4ERB2_DROBS|nr:312 [Drosophila busckii]
MLKTQILRCICSKRNSLRLVRGFHHEFSKPEQTTSTDGNKTEQKEAKPTFASGVQNKYKIFRDEEALEIFDVEEARYQQQELPAAAEQDQYEGLNLKRGVRGVFDIEDLVQLLRKENVDDIFVCYVPEELKYVDHLAVCSARSYRHMLSTAEFVRRIFKIKRSKGDLLPRIEGEKSRDWMAMDLGNIALHIFSPQAREHYDLESLWAIGSQYDTESQKPQNPYGDIFTAKQPLT